MGQTRTPTEHKAELAGLRAVALFEALKGSIVLAAGFGLVKDASRACNFMFFPLQELAPRIAESLNRALLRFCAARFAPFIGAQYIVRAKKAA